MLLHGPFKIFKPAKDKKTLYRISYVMNIMHNGSQGENQNKEYQ